MANVKDINSGLTWEALDDLFQVNTATGIFIWKNPTNPRMKGKIAGCQTHVTGYVMIYVTHPCLAKKTCFKRHRLMWFYVHRKWPPADIDHKNCKPGDDWIDNLREATRSQNMYNSRKMARNKSGHKGVHWDASKGKWRTKIRYNRKEITIGRYSLLKDAIAARQAAIIQYHGSFARAA